MAEKFELFRLSLLQRPTRDLFDQDDISREDYIRRAFGKTVEYTYGDISYFYVPSPDEVPAEVIIGRIGRSHVVEENRPPSESLAETTRDVWKASYIVIDPREHDDGQKVALEIDRDVASPGTILFGLLREINRTNPTSPYSIEAAPIFSIDTFWEFAEKNKGSITSLKFEFVVPNMFGGSDSIVDELRAFREKEKARRVQIALANSEGLDVNTERTREAVDYVGKSGGIIRARAKENRRYSSTDKSRKTSIADNGPLGEAPFARIARLAKQILGRE